MTYDDSQLTDLHERAMRAAQAAADLLMQRPDALSVDSKSTATDVVTDMDRRSEDLLVSMLLDGHGDDGILGEEGSDTAGTSGVRWVIDPLDGTVNYLYDLPIWGVNVAAEIDGNPVVGVVVAPAVDQTYSAVIGRGAHQHFGDDRRQLSVSSQTDPGFALVATGFGYDAQRRAAQGSVAARILPKVRDLRRPGAACLDLCWVASGRLDAYFERGPKPWDHAAGGVVVTEAGGRIGGLAGEPATEEMVLAANPTLFATLDEWLTDWNAASDEVETTDS